MLSSMFSCCVLRCIDRQHIVFTEWPVAYSTPCVDFRGEHACRCLSRLAHTETNFQHRGRAKDFSAHVYVTYSVCPVELLVVTVAAVNFLVTLCHMVTRSVKRHVIWCSTTTVYHLGRWGRWGRWGKSGTKTEFCMLCELDLTFQHK